MRQGITAIFVLMALLSAIGCASRPSGNGGVTASMADPNAPPGERLRALALAETGRGDLSPIDASIPPGIEAEALRPRDGGSVAAAMPLEDAIRYVETSSALEPAVVQENATLPLEKRIEAQSYYAQGLQAASDGQEFIAVRAFERALEIDPDEPRILRQLARSYAGIPNLARAVEHYQRLRRLVPGDSEANFVVGLTAVNQRQFEDGISALGPVRLSAGGFDHDPAANLLADFALSVAFRRLGYDRASIDAALRALDALEKFDGRTIYRNEVGSMVRQQSDVWRSVGDAYCRLGDAEAAVDAYERASHLPSVDPISLAARRIYAELLRGRRFRAQLRLLESLESVRWSVDDRLIDLASYLRDAASPTEILAGAIAAEGERRERTPQLVRLQAALLPEEAGVSLLRRLIAENPADFDAAAQLFEWLGVDKPAQLANLATALAADHPSLAIQYGDALYERIGVPPSVLEALDHLDAGPAGVIASRLLFLGGFAARAYDAAAKAVVDWRNEPAAWVALLDAAAALGEFQLIDEAVSDARRFNDPPVWRAIARAKRLLGEQREAIEAAEHALEVEPQDVQSLLELARTQLMARETASNAIHSIERALEIDPSSDQAYELLVALYGTEGPLADGGRFSEAAARLRRANPESPLLARIMADQAIAQRRPEQAVEILSAAYAKRPTDASLLSRLVLAWIQTGQLEEASRWLQGTMEQRPHDPELVRQWVRVLLQQRKFDEAEAALRARLSHDQRDPLALSMLEVVLRSAGRDDEAFALAEDRLLERPEGTQRSIDLAALYASSGRIEDAAEEINTLRRRFDRLPRQAAARILGVALQLPDEPRAEQARFAIVDSFINRFPDAPFSVYSVGLVSLARLNVGDAVFEGFARRAVEYATFPVQASAQGTPTQAQALGRAYRDAAQLLVESGHPDAAARLVMLRLSAEEPLDREVEAFLGLLAQASFVLAEKPEDAMDVLEWMIDRGHGDLLPIPRGAADPLLEGLYSLSVYCTLAGLDDVAEPLLVRVLERQPDHAMAANNLGYRRIEQNRNDRATISMIERAHALEPDNPNILDTLAWLRYKQGRFTANENGEPGALELLEEAIRATRSSRSAAESPEVYDHLGDVQWRLGRSAEAIDAWRKAISIAGDENFRIRSVQGAARYQESGWGIAGNDPEALFRQTYGDMLERAKRKIEQASKGEAPAIEPTFAEAARRNGEANDPPMISEDPDGRSQ